MKRPWLVGSEMRSERGKPSPSVSFPHGSANVSPATPSSDCVSGGGGDVCHWVSQNSIVPLQYYR